MRPRSLLHRGILQDRRAVLPVEKFTDKGTTDIVLINVPLAVRVVAVAVGHVPETRDPTAARSIDIAVRC